MVKVLFDTNIVIDVLKGIPPARDVVSNLPQRAVSIITWMEVMVGTSATLTDATRDFLRGFQLIGLDENIAEHAVIVRQVHRLKLPDAVIWATAKVNGLSLLTLDTKGFPRQHPDIIVPYEV
ncbi:MAG: type II toxin-antitoxin system VapC family toxin [Allorhizobium sp.]